LIIVDPETNYTLCTIKKPGLKISCYREDGRNCIKLQKYIDECQARPDFGFDQDQTSVDKEQKLTQPNMLQLINDYQNQKALWSSVNEMKDVKLKVMRLIWQRQNKLPNYLKKREEIKALFDTIKI